MAQEIIKARVWQKVDSLENWEVNPLILGHGEQAFVVDDYGQPINFKIGDGTRTFAELPFWIQYDGGAYVPVQGSVLPMPQQDIAYTMVLSGTYTFGANTIVIPEGNIAVLYWMGSGWVKASEMNIRGQDGTNAQSFNFKGTVDSYSQLPTSGNLQNDAWYIPETSSLYVYNGSQFPPEDEGMNITTQVGEVQPESNTLVLRDGDGNVHGNLLVTHGAGQTPSSGSALRGIAGFTDDDTDDNAIYNFPKERVMEFLAPTMSIDANGWRVLDYGWKVVYQIAIEDIGNIDANSSIQGQIIPFPLGIENGMWSHLSYNTVTGQAGINSALGLARTDPEVPDMNAFRFLYYNLTGSAIQTYSDGYIEMTSYEPR